MPSRNYHFLALSTVIVCNFFLCSSTCMGQELEGARHGYADSNGVKIHYVTMGQGPLVVMIHGFPDYWYTWRKQMPVLAKNFQVVAIDQRGYNKSDQPKGVAEYAMPKLVGDVAAVIRHLKRDKATIVGHDWGGAVSWTFAMMKPEMTERLIILNLPHPRGMSRELARNKEQQKNSQYARDFQKEGAHLALSAKGLTGWITDPEAKRHYIQAFERSSFEGMLNYYKANYPKNSGSQNSASPSINYPKIKCPVLMFHGLKDKALHSDGLNNTWDWLEKDLTLVTIPNAGHFVQQDAADLVTKRLVNWLQSELKK